MSERLPCQTPGCTGSILPATAQRTGGICMPCQQRKLAEQRQAYIEQNRKEINRYAGVEDRVEILTIMHSPQKPDPLIREVPYPQTEQELYHELTVEERERMESYAVQLLEEEEVDQAETILLSLVCYTDTRLGPGLESFLRTGNYYPAILYKDADAVIRDRLIAQVETDPGNRNHLLLALAWIGDEEVVRLFAQWRQSPPAWASALYIAPEMYAREAGWELDAGGGKRLLIHPECYPFKVYKEEIAEAPRTPAAVTALQTGAASCPWCGGGLTVLFDYDLQHPLLQFMKLPGKRLRIAACMHCNCYGTVFMNVDLEGGYAWSDYNVVPEYLPDNNGGPASPAWHVMQLSEQPVGTYESAHWTLEALASQIGGHPAWIQDADYPACPCCSQTMTFTAQMDMEQAEDSEGIYYAFLCSDCLITAVNYQQT
ncbi:DUF1963 domain-containing protein [Paenibacillus tritici]|uniref:DUF1963 domain-containing protein n=1 Tax=Paenibacillus tritici TaxID=1873425 RepID=A0ABX2DPD0_9BACL|nr:DUF1963 domain-containing protein [Paenibacillus tritici]NQX45479.1 DUF1963 domain-containing protein [Paenibacillus tritici]